VPIDNFGDEWVSHMMHKGSVDNVQNEFYAHSASVDVLNLINGVNWRPALNK
jgi:hypothetical protein